MLHPAPTTHHNISTIAASKSEIFSLIKRFHQVMLLFIDAIPADFYKANPDLATELLHRIIKEARKIYLMIGMMG